MVCTNIKEAILNLGVCYFQANQAKGQSPAMLRTLALLSALLCFSLAQDPDLLARFGNFRQLSASPRYDLYWNANDTTIVFAVRVETEGWVGFGISPNGLMIGSDVVMGFVDDTTGDANFTVSIYVS